MNTVPGTDRDLPTAHDSDAEAAKHAPAARAYLERAGIGLDSDVAQMLGLAS